MCVCVHLVVRLLLLGLLAGLASAESGPTRIAGDALGSDSVKHACIDHDGRSTEAARSALRGFETAAEDTSQPACGAIRDMLGIPADVQRTIFNRGSLGGPRKTGSAFDGCRGSDRVEKMLEGDSAHAWDEGVALRAGLLEPPPGCDEVRAIVKAAATPGQPSLREWCCASAAVLLLQACGACWLLLGQRAPRSGAASGQRASKAVCPRLSRSRGAVALLLLLSFLPVARAGSGEAGSGEADSGEQGSRLWEVPPSLPPPSPPLYPLAYYTITTTPGSYPSEVSWDLRCGGTVVLSSAPYTGSDFQTEYGVSLSPGVECELHMHDSYGDGWNDATWSGLGQEGLTVASGYEEKKSFVVPFAPPSPPPLAPSPQPPLLPPPQLPSPPLPPLVPGESIARTPQDIRDEINKATAEKRNASVFIPPGARLAFSSNVACSDDMLLSVRSSGEGATLDGKKSSNMFSITGGCSLYLEALHFVDGFGEYGGAVHADGAGDIAMRDVSFTGCEATKDGGGMLVSSSGGVVLEGASFSECTAAYGGGGMFVQNNGDVSLASRS